VAFKDLSNFLECVTLPWQYGIVPVTLALALLINFFCVSWIKNIFFCYSLKLQLTHLTPKDQQNFWVTMTTYLKIVLELYYNRVSNRWVQCNLSNPTHQVTRKMCRIVQVLPLTTFCGTGGDIRFCGQKQTLIIMEDG
jgi:hypothetical protein